VIVAAATYIASPAPLFVRPFLCYTSEVPCIRKLNPEWDLDVSAGSAQYLRGAAWAAQKIRQVLQLLLGEWFLDQSLGFPLLEDVLIKDPDLTLVKATYRAKIKSVRGIVDVPKLTLAIDRPTRTLTVDFVATYYDGTTIPGQVSAAPPV
jgi:hypothetical protein